MVSAVAEPSTMSNSIAPPVAKSILPVAGSIIKLPEPVDIVFPFICMLSTRRLSILLFESVIIAELAVSVPALWSSIST